MSSLSPSTLSPSVSSALSSPFPPLGLRMASPSPPLSASPYIHPSAEKCSPPAHDNLVALLLFFLVESRSLVLDGPVALGLFCRILALRRLFSPLRIYSSACDPDPAAAVGREVPWLFTPASSTRVLRPLWAGFFPNVRSSHQVTTRT